MKIPFVDLSAQYSKISMEINEKITQVISRGDFTLGEELRLFEEEFAQYCNGKYAIGVGSGTDALLFSLLACGIKPGDEVITAANTFVATIEAISFAGAKPVLVDINPNNYNLDLNNLERAINKKTKAVLPVHLYGQAVNMDRLVQIAKFYHLCVIEDACQAHGAEYRNKRVGSLGDLGAFSFYPAKNLGAYGDGGAVVTDNEEFAEKIKMLRNHGQKEKYFHKILGFTSRLDNLQAAILRIKLKYLDVWNKARNDCAKLYGELLRGTSLKIPEIEPQTFHVFHLYVVRCPASANEALAGKQKRNDLANFLKERGVATGIHYPIPIHLSESCKDLGYKKGDFPVTEKAAEEILSLPMFPELTKENINYIVETIKEFEKTQK